MFQSVLIQIEPSQEPKEINVSAGTTLKFSKGEGHPWVYEEQAFAISESSGSRSVDAVGVKVSEDSADYAKVEVSIKDRGDPEATFYFVSKNPDFCVPVLESVKLKDGKWKGILEIRGKKLIEGSVPNGYVLIEVRKDRSDGVCLGCLGVVTFVEDERTVVVIDLKDWNLPRYAHAYDTSSITAERFQQIYGRFAKKVRVIHSAVRLSDYEEGYVRNFAWRFERRDGGFVYQDNEKAMLTAINLALFEIKKEHELIDDKTHALVRVAKVYSRKPEPVGLVHVGGIAIKGGQVLVVGDGDATIAAHEFGHNLGLSDVNKTGNLMHYAIDEVDGGAAGATAGTALSFQRVQLYHDERATEQQWRVLAKNS